MYIPFQSIRCPTGEVLRRRSTSPVYRPIAGSFK